MKLVSWKTALSLSVVLMASSAFAQGLSLEQVQGCIAQEKELVKTNHPLKAQFILQEREGSVAELIRMMKENREQMKSLSAEELVGSEAKALSREFSEMNQVLSLSQNCQEARRATLKFANEHEQAPLPMIEVFFIQNDKNDAEIPDWNRDAKAALKDAGYVKAEGTLDARKHPALTILAASGETTSVLEQQFAFNRDTTMKSALRTIVGHDAPAIVLEDRLTEKMRKEALARMDSISNVAKGLVSK